MSNGIDWFTQPKGAIWDSLSSAFWIQSLSNSQLSHWFKLFSLQTVQTHSTVCIAYLNVSAHQRNLLGVLASVVCGSLGNSLTPPPPPWLQTFHLRSGASQSFEALPSLSTRLSSFFQQYLNLNSFLMETNAKTQNLPSLLKIIHNLATAIKQMLLLTKILIVMKYLHNSDHSTTMEAKTKSLEDLLVIKC